jgi:drug/metabolite transporter (DMT)-like permease
VLGAALFFGVNASVAKVVLSAGIEASRLTALRCTGAALGLLVVLGLTAPSRLRIRWRDLPTFVVLGLSGAALLQWLYFVAIDRLPVGVALLLEFTAPLMVAVHAALWRREPVRPRLWAALGTALGGMALVAQVWRDTGLDGVGVAAGLASAACLATFYVLSQRTVARYHPLTSSFWLFTVGAAFWSIATPWWHFDRSVLDGSASLLGNLADVQVPVWAAVVAVVIGGTLIPYSLEVAALRHLPPTVVGVVAMSEPVLAATVAWVWLGQALGPIQVVGGAIVLLGVALVQSARAEPAADTGPAPQADPAPAVEPALV